jgi:uncharacterized protein DUF3750
MTTYFVCAAVLAVLFAAAVPARDWRTASREPVGLAPDPATTPEPLIQVYAARAIGWRGWFGVHTWVAVKPEGKGYVVYEVIGWRLYSSDTAVVIRNRPPDGRWFGAEPELIAERRGAGVSALIERIDKAAREYPWPGEYKVWPGPNSNTFTAWILRAVPELAADLPPTAVGKDYSGDRLITTAPSGSGVQLSLFGLLGLTASAVEGLEVNVLGLTFGVNPFDPAVKLPVVGRLGPARAIAASPSAAAAAAAGRKDSN